MDEDRKPSALAKLRNLKPKQKLRLMAWLESGMAYHKAVPLVEKEFGISTSVGALSHFWESEVVPLRLARRQHTAKLAARLGEEQQAKPVKWDAILDDSLKELAADLMNTPGADTEKIFFLMQLVLKTRDQGTKRVELQLKRDKFEFDAAKAALKHLDALRAIKANKSIDQGERLKQARLQLFGVTPE
jgi:hypothetical protein